MKVIYFIESPVYICRQRCLTAGVSHRIVSFIQKSEVYLENYAVSEKLPEWFEIKIPIAYHRFIV